jgi:lipoprotein-anchoring transpeptidase ErfK/SrfK
MGLRKIRGSTNRSRLVLLATPALLVALWMWPEAASPAEAYVVRPTQQLVVLHRAHAAFAKPTTDSKALGRVKPHRPLTGERTVLPVLGTRTGWLHVRLPGRPNGHTGWIRQAATALRTTSWHLVVDISKRRVTVYRKGRVIRVFRAIVGKPSTPTPRGEFFVEESVQLKPKDIGGPFVLTLSARSTVYQEYAGGPGQIAIHGRDNIGGVLGTAVSHGCVRLADPAIRWLVRWGRVGPGVPVTITR